MATLLEYKPYTYLLGWSKLNTWYYGVEYKNQPKRRLIANPLNLWTTYFTSSKPVKRFVSEHGDPDIIQVRKIFTTREEAKSWESKVLTRLKAASNPKWLNRCDVGGTYVVTDEIIQKIKATKAANKQTPWNKGLKGVQVAWNKGKTIYTDEQKKAIGKRSQRAIVVNSTELFASIMDFANKYSIPINEARQVIANCDLHDGIFKPTISRYKKYDFVTSIRRTNDG